MAKNTNKNPVNEANVEKNRFNEATEKGFFELFEKKVRELQLKYSNCLPILPVSNNVGKIGDENPIGIIIHLNEEMLSEMITASKFGDYETKIDIGEKNGLTYCVFTMVDESKNKAIIFPAYFSSQMKLPLGESERLIVYFTNVEKTYFMGTRIENNPFY